MESETCDQNSGAINEIFENFEILKIPTWQNLSEAKKSKDMTYVVGVKRKRDFTVYLLIILKILYHWIKKQSVFLKTYPNDLKN